MNNLILLLKNLIFRTPLFSKLFNLPSFGQFIRFSVVGLINTLIDFLVYFGLTRAISWFGEYYLAANALSFVAASTNSFFLNKNWTFGNQKKDRGQYFKFIAVVAFTLLLSEVVLFFLVNRLGIYDLFAKILVLIVSVVSNFFLSKFMVFKD